MLRFLNTPITYVWGLLVILTALSWYLGDDIAAESPAKNQWLAVTLLVLAFFKVRLVIMHFMEVTTAPLALQIIFEAWILVVCIAINLIYLGYL